MERWDASQQAQVKNMDNLFHRSSGLCGHIHPDARWLALSIVPPTFFAHHFPQEG